MAETIKFIRRKTMISISSPTAIFRYRAWCLVILLLLASGDSLNAQSERKLIRDGNKLYESKKYSDAEVAYRKSLEKNKESFAGNYDLGNAYYKQQKFDEAQSQFQKSLQSKNLSQEEKSKIYHNLGNTLLEAKKFPESIEAYKNALRMNPKDNDTRYNLAYAQSMLQQQQQQQDQQQNKQDQKDQDKKKQDQKDQQKQQKEKEEQNKEQQPRDRRQDLSKEDAEKMLKALNNDEKNTQKKLVKKETTRIQIEKQW
jgi:Ca-activated chloride channel homolog